MAASNTPKAIFVIGKKEGSQFDAATIRRFAAEQMAKAKESGFDVQGLIIDPQAPHEVILGQIREQLQARQWDGVVVGFGVRGDPTLTVLFEDVVNICVQEFQITRFGFNTTPGDTAEAVIRAFSA